MPVDVVRDAAVDVLLRVFERGVHLDVSLDKTLRRKDPSERGRRFLTQLVYGTVRHRILLDHVLEPLLRQPLSNLPPPIWVILRMGVYQSLFLSQVTFPAMVHTSVDLAKKRGHAGMGKLVNAVLRRAPRSLDDVKLPPRENTVEYLRIRHSLPRWIARAWIEQFGPETATEMAEAGNEPALPTLRVNTRKTTVDALSEALRRTGYLAEKRTPVPEELTLVDGPPATRSKLFQAGHFMLQDPSSMLPPHLLEPRAGDWVLDMSAAPGGKSTHIAQLADGARVVAMDLRPNKLDRVVDNAERLELENVFPLCGDGQTPPVAPVFDRVLLDAPCTGLGTLRRHPDIKWRLKPEDVDELAEIQVRLLRSALDLCKNGGLIVYSVCTLSKPETEGVAEAILRDGRARLEDGPEWLNPWRIDWGRYRILPQRDGMDGFFLMRLRKES